MIKIQISILIGLMLAGYSTSTLAESNAAQAAKDGLQAVTIFVDISGFNRKHGGAKKLTKSHQEFAAYGYQLVSVDIYTENGDLEGFFVSYQKPSRK